MFSRVCVKKAIGNCNYQPAEGDFRGGNCDCYVGNSDCYVGNCDFHMEIAIVRLPRAIFTVENAIVRLPKAIITMEIAIVTLEIVIFRCRKRFSGRIRHLLYVIYNRVSRN